MVKSFKDMFINEKTTFKQLVYKFDVPRNHLFRYVQVCSFV